MIWTIPNILTMLRLLAAPGVAVMFLYFDRPWADIYALVLFVGAAATDFVDGYIARAWNQHTRFGAMLDPIADKVMVVIALFVITGYSGMNPWIILPAVMILFREVFVSGLREFLAEDRDKLAVTKLAKWKTTLQMVAIAVLFAGMAAERMEWWEPLADFVFSFGVGLLWVAGALTLLTGADYFAKALPFLKAPE